MKNPLPFFPVAWVNGGLHWFNAARPPKVAHKKPRTRRLNAPWPFETHDRALIQRQEAFDTWARQRNALAA